MTKPIEGRGDKGTQGLKISFSFSIKKHPVDQFVEGVGVQVCKSSLYRWKDRGTEFDFIP